MASRNMATNPIINEHDPQGVSIAETEKSLAYSCHNNNVDNFNMNDLSVHIDKGPPYSDARIAASCPTMLNDSSGQTGTKLSDTSTSTGSASITDSERTTSDALSVSDVPESDPINGSLVSLSDSRYSGDGFGVDNMNDVVLRTLPRRSTRLAMSEFMLTSLRKRRSYTVQDAKEHAHMRLQEQLERAQTELKLRDEECEKLSKIRDQMELELEELTACLFEEANKMVQEAYTKRASAEKQLAEAMQQIEVLNTELIVFKSLVLTSTPNTPNRHLNPQIDTPPPTTKKKESKPFWKGHRRSTSHHDFTSESRKEAECRHQENVPKEIDHSSYVEFVSWRENASMDHTYEFLMRIMSEDIIPCLHFVNKKLSRDVRGSIETNSLMIEPITSSSPIPRKCCLTDSPKTCNYKIKLDGQSEWLPISQHCRNRIAAVCDFYTYVRYIVQGLVKSDDKDIYNEVVRLRKQMTLARLGYS